MKSRVHLYRPSSWMTYCMRILTGVKRDRAVKVGPRIKETTCLTCKERYNAELDRRSESI